MSRKVRIPYPGAIYHVLNRGDHGEDPFLDEEDRERFLAALQEACAKTAWQVHSYCLMSNHFHWVIETPRLQPGARARTGSENCFQQFVRCQGKPLMEF